MKVPILTQCKTIKIAFVFLNFKLVSKLLDLKITRGKFVDYS